MLKNHIVILALISLMIAASVSAQELKVGQMAPHFKLKNQKNQDVSFPPAGKWAVLAFYPMAGTPG